MSFNQEQENFQQIPEQPLPVQPIQTVGELPTTMYCLKCRQNRNVADVNLISTEFKSKKKGTTMKRSTYQGKCGTCGTVVRRFASGAKKS